MRNSKSVLITSGMIVFILAVGYGHLMSQTAVSIESGPIAPRKTSPANPVGPILRFDASQGSKIRIEGKSLIHDWSAESSQIDGFLEAGPSFPTSPDQAASPGKVEARVEASIPVRELKTTIRPFDDIMHKTLKSSRYPQIVYRLEELVLIQPANGKGAPHRFRAKGIVAVAGVTNDISMPVTVLPLGNQKLSISGEAPLKMTDFNIHRPGPVFRESPPKVDEDEVKVSFEWVVAETKAAFKTAPGKPE